jgi:hypothetical protein
MACPAETGFQQNGGLTPVFWRRAMGGLFGLVILVLDIFAGYNVVTSSVDTPKKIGWVLLIVVLPVIGFIIWALAGPRGKKLF